MMPIPSSTTEQPSFGAATTRWRGIAAGAAVSLLLHALLLFGYRRAPPPPSAPLAPEVVSLTVWIRPPPPPAPARPPDKPAALPHNKPASKPSPPAPAQAITLPAPAARPAKPPVPDSPPTFDMAAALQMARQIASEPDPSRAGLPVAQLDKKPLYPKSTESQLARDIASAKRRDCKDGIPGGLLAPLYLLMDKKDSGCKW